MNFLGGSDDKASAYNVGDLGSIPGLGRSPGEGKGNPLQYSGLENPMDGGAWWAKVHGVKKSRTGLSNFSLSLCQSIHVPALLELGLHPCSGCMPPIHQDPEHAGGSCYPCPPALRFWHCKAVGLRGAQCLIHLFSILRAPELIFRTTESESCSVVSNSLQTPWTIQSMEFSRSEYWSG